MKHWKKSVGVKPFWETIQVTCWKPQSHLVVWKPSNSYLETLMTRRASWDMVYFLHFKSRWLSQEELACDPSMQHHSLSFVQSGFHHCSSLEQSFGVKYFGWIGMILSLLYCSLNSILAIIYVILERIYCYRFCLEMLPEGPLDDHILLNFNSLENSSTHSHFKFQSMYLSRKFAQETKIY